MEKRTRNIILSCICLLAGFVIVDIFNLPSRLGIRIDNINWDAMSLICGNVVVVGLAVITYFLLNKSQKDREINQRNIAVCLLQSTYENCKTELSIEDSAKELVKIFKKDNKISTSLRTDNKNEKYEQERPFTNHADILEMAKQGIITESEYRMYLKVKNEFRLYIGTFYWKVENKEYVEYFHNASKERLSEYIEEALKELQEASA